MSTTLGELNARYVVPINTRNCPENLPYRSTAFSACPSVQVFGKFAGEVIVKTGYCQAELFDVGVEESRLDLTAAFHLHKYAVIAGFRKTIGDGNFRGDFIATHLGHIH